MFIILRSDGVMKISDTGEIDATDLPCKAFYIEYNGPTTNIEIDQENQIAVIDGKSFPLQPCNIFNLAAKNPQKIFSAVFETIDLEFEEEGIVIPGFDKGLKLFPYIKIELLEEDETVLEQMIPIIYSLELPGQ